MTLLGQCLALTGMENEMRRRVFVGISGLAVVALVVALSVLGQADNVAGDRQCDWQPGDDYKMHFPQLPNEAGWDVQASWPTVLADDWECTETGFVKDIHFWGSWRNGETGVIDSFRLEIYSDIPADQNPDGYSKPGSLLWQKTIETWEEAVYQPAVMEGWFDPETGEALPDNHQEYHQYNVCLDQADWFEQEAGTIYWLAITAYLDISGASSDWGWKSTLDHFNDDGVWLDPTGLWLELYEPIAAEPIVNQFQVAIDPQGIFLGGGGQDAYGDGWYFYPMEDWWNIWFYDHPYDPTRLKEVQLEFDVFKIDPGLPGYFEIAVNWSTDLWSIEQPPGDSAPPLPGVDEMLYIGRATVFAGEMYEGHYVFDYVIPDYNPEWVSVDVRGYNFDIPMGTITHTCLPQDQVSLDLAFVITGDPEVPAVDTVKCEPQGTMPHPPDYWYDVTPTQYGRCDFHVVTYDSIAGNYSNWLEPAGWQHQIHKVGSEWWISWWSPGCADPIFSTFRFGYTNPNPNVWAHWTTTIDGSSDPFASIVDSSGRHTADPDGYGYRVHVPFFEEQILGACCLEDGSCIDTDREDCNSLGGTFKGPGTMCLGDLNNNGINDACDHWEPGDPHKMHFPQLPDEAGWDVMATAPIVLADDWLCTETGWVKDIHFWGSWMDDIVGNVQAFLISIYTDIPADPPQIPYSRPGDKIWEAEVTQFGVLPLDPPTLEGWFDPSQMFFIPDNHLSYFQYDVYLPENFWFWQEEGTIYWLAISAIVDDAEPGIWGWKSSLDHFNDDAVWAFLGEESWIEMYEPPDFIHSLDLSFVITTWDECDVIIGDANGSGGIDIDDIVYLITHVFQGGPAPTPYPIASGDANCDCAVDIDDIVYEIAHVFQGGPPPCTCEEWIAICGPLH